MRPPRRRARRLVKWLALFGFLGGLFLLAPIAYVEVACRGTLSPQIHQPLITEPAQKRVEANSYLTYPEWHMVYAYDGLAEVLKTGDEHQLDYVQSVIGFWQSACALMRVADAHGGADWPTRSMIHTIGASFMVEMGAKALLRGVGWPGVRLAARPGQDAPGCSDRRDRHGLRGVPAPAAVVPLPVP